jgi:hypothetical protein
LTQFKVLCKELNTLIMKKILFVFLLLAGCVFANAQADSTLNAYTGKYTFGDDSPVKEITVTVESGTLMVASAMGNTEFKKTDTKDVFEVVAYGGMATFKRNEAGKVIGVKIEVQDIAVEGTRSEGIVLEEVYLFPLQNVAKLAL